ncbi:MAG: tRNA (5-methylaminomethyl-2-thiouridine)(34)-methyltransferase MnmD [Crocinitomicaceae bacterium]
MKRQIAKTADGSTTIFIPEMNENYHSHHGAIQEAEHVFIKNGLEYLQKNKVRIFELGFGTGLNALLTYKRAMELSVEVDYLGLEAFPVESELIEGLNYVAQIGQELGGVFQEMHSSPWNAKTSWGEFSLTKVDRKIQELNIEGLEFDLIYFDAFGPRAQDEMWQLPVLEKVSAMLPSGGVLVTYCAQGQFKRHLKSLGFKIERLPGPPGKREMTRATKVED